MAPQAGGSFLTNGDYNVTGAWSFTQTPTIAGGNSLLPGGGGALDLALTGSKSMTNGAFTSLGNVAVATNGASGGVLRYMAFASNGTDQQAITGVVSYAVVDKAGVQTLTITEVVANQAKAVSTGTYTLAFTFASPAQLRVQPTTSLSATTHTITFAVLPIVGAVTP